MASHVLNQAIEFIRILGSVQEPCDLAPLFHLSEVPNDVIEFPTKSYTSDRVPALERVDYRLRIALLSSSWNSPLGTGALIDSARPSTRGIDDSITPRHATVF